MSDISIKICGLREEETLRVAVSAGADFVGFVHYPKSPRHVSIEQMATLIKLLPKQVKSVAVLVNPEDSLLEKIATEAKPDFVQLHGEETVDRVKEIAALMSSLRTNEVSVAIQNGKNWIASEALPPRNDKSIGIIKAIPVKTADDIKQAEEFYAIADYILFDAKPTDKNMLHGGNGISFDWNILTNANLSEKWFLSGGLNPNNIAEALRITGARMLDVSSGVESSAGVKDAALIKQFIKASRTA